MNILLITADQWRGDCVGYMSHPVVKTPNVDAFAKDAVVFENHYAPCAPCSPARASIYTGLYQMNHRVVSNGTPLDERFDNVALAARRAGYVPTLFGYTDTTLDVRTLDLDDPRGKTFEEPLPGFEYGQELREDDATWKEWMKYRGRGDVAHHEVDRSDGERVSVAPTAYDAGETQTAFLVEKFGDWLKDQDDAWFAHISFLRPHPPLVVPAPYNDVYSPAEVPTSIGAGGDKVADGHPLVLGFRMQSKGTDFQTSAPGTINDFSQHDFARIRAVYYGLISEVDDQLGRMFSMIKDAGVWDNTLIIFTSDHGEMMGDHGVLGKGGFYPQSQYIPLAIRMPDGCRGQRVDAFTSSVDLFPTILDFIDQTSTHAPDGASLLPFLRGETPAQWRKAVLWEFDFRGYLDDNVRAAMNLTTRDCCLVVRMDQNWLYMQSRAFDPLLFDLSEDPDCLINEAGRETDARLAQAEALIRDRLALADNTLADVNVTLD